MSCSTRVPCHGIPNITRPTEFTIGLVILIVTHHKIGCTSILWITKTINLGQNWVFAMVFLEILPRLYLQLTSWSSDWNQNRHVNDSALSARRPWLKALLLIQYCLLRYIFLEWFRIGVFYLGRCCLLVLQPLMKTFIYMQYIGDQVKGVFISPFYSISGIQRGRGE